MNRFLHKARKDSLSLIVSLPANSEELARAALSGGAECLKVHIRVHHDASGTHFGSLDEERANLAAILKVAGGVPVGIVAGAETPATPEELRQLAEMGIDFFDLYDFHMPAWMLKTTDMNRVVAVGSDYDVSRLQALEPLGMEMLEAAVVPHDQYGQPLTVRDLSVYRCLAKAVSVPTIVPSQKRILPEEVALLGATGLRAVMIGAIVTGKEASTIESVTRTFREAVEDFRRLSASREV
ncbi:MAG: hypothetical protein HY318_16675 [Armatimonadetes bacterium]|nr:hypothetical protein [Armatimonadota bacterium]